MTKAITIKIISHYPLLMRKSVILMGILILSSIVLLEENWDTEISKEGESESKDYFYFFFENKADYNDLLEMGEIGYENLQAIKFSEDYFPKVSRYNGVLKDAHLF